jgi:Fe-S-cluster-containing dehydrogenase component/DMSO reductase anchor subunit
LPLLDNYLREQNDLTAVERFSRDHDQGFKARSKPEQDQDDRVYRELIPLTLPRAGEQYSFHVDLDRCTGCKACVTACHSLNGLDEDETWRFVGVLHGGTPAAPVQQTVTTACHHCVDPACMSGCPVEAYVKDPVTGIVKHLDDQCIGCQYCTLTCPYEVPQYNKRLGIVRKCDMCSGRLAAGEAPACVQACPNEAISIRIVSQDTVIDDGQADAFLPGAPSPGITAPTTVYRSNKPLPRNTLPADFYSVRPSHQHRPLVVMLVLTQLSVGAFCMDRVLQSLLPSAAVAALQPVQALIALVVGLLALGASTAHLGRPLYAFRAFLGLKTSWMSREIVAFGAFAGAAMFYAALAWHGPIAAMLGLPDVPEPLLRVLEPATSSFVVLSGLLGVYCSVMIYHVTLRRFWLGWNTALKFFGTTVLLGVSTSATVMALCGLTQPELWPALGPVLTLLVKTMMLSAAFKLAHELSLLLHLGAKQHHDLKRSALLIVNDLKRPAVLRLICGVLCGLVLPLITLLVLASSAPEPRVFVLMLACWLGLLFGELLERSLFFAAVSAPRMPGAFS